MVDQWARWTFWPASVLSIVAVVMLLASVPDRTWHWFVPFYFVTGTPLIVRSFISDFRELKAMRRSRKDSEN